MNGNSKNHSIHIPTSIVFGGGSSVVLLIEIGVTAYLMRILGPEPFGLISMVTALVAIFAVIGDAGIGSSLVSDRALSSQRIAAATLMTMTLGFGFVLLGLCTTKLAVLFYGDERIGVIWIVSCSIVGFSILKSVPNAIAQRQERFILISWLPVVSGLSASIAAIWLAQSQLDYWPILLQKIVFTSIGVTGIWLVMRPRMVRPARSDFKEIYNFSRGILGFNTLNALNRNADNVIIGRFLGGEALGLYQLAYRVLSLPLQELGRLSSVIAYPRITRFAPDWENVTKSISGVMRDLSMFATPFCLGVFIAAPEIIIVIFGESWLEGLLPFRVLSLLGIYQVPFAQLGLCYLVSRNTGLMARWGMWATPFIVASFFIGLPWGIGGVAITYSLMSIILSYPQARMAGSALGNSPWPFFQGTIKGIGMGLVGTLPLLLIYFILKMTGVSSLVLLLCTISGGAIGEIILVFGVISRKKPFASI